MAYRHGRCLTLPFRSAQFRQKRQDYWAIATIGRRTPARWCAALLHDEAIHSTRQPIPAIHAWVPGPIAGRSGRSNAHVKAWVNVPSWPEDKAARAGQRASSQRHNATQSSPTAFWKAVLQDTAPVGKFLTHLSRSAFNKRTADVVRQSGPAEK